MRTAHLLPPFKITVASVSVDWCALRTLHGFMLKRGSNELIDDYYKSIGLFIISCILFILDWILIVKINFKN